MAGPLGRYDKNTAGWRAYALSSDLGDACLDVAEKGRAWAESESPIDTGRYATSFRVEAGTENLGRYGPRVTAELWNDAPYAATVEFGSDPSITAGRYHSGNRAQRVIARTAEHLGLT